MQRTLCAGLLCVGLVTLGVAISYGEPEGSGAPLSPKESQFRLEKQLDEIEEYEQMQAQFTGRAESVGRAAKPGRRNPGAFSLVGTIDIDGDGKSDRDLLRKLVAAARGTIDNEVDDDGNLLIDGSMVPNVGAPPSPRITERTKFLVRGTLPAERAQRTTAAETTARRILDLSGELDRQAHEHGVRIISLKDFLRFIGYEATVRADDRNRYLISWRSDDRPAGQPQDEIIADLKQRLATLEADNKRLVAELDKRAEEEVPRKSNAARESGATQIEMLQQRIVEIELQRRLLASKREKARAQGDAAADDGLGDDLLVLDQQLRILRSDRKALMSKAAATTNRVPAFVNPNGSTVESSEPLAEVLVEGNWTIPTPEILKRIKLRAGMTADLAQLKEDVASLYRSRWFLQVEPRFSANEKGTVLVFKVE